MNRRSVMGVIVLAASLVSTQAVYAAPFAGHTPGNAIYAKATMVKFTLRNDSTAPVKLMVGDNAVTLEPGKPVNVAVADGTKIVAVETTTKHQAGEVLATASAGLRDATVTIQ